MSDRIDITLTATVDADGVALTQTPGGAGSLILNGAFVSGGVATFPAAQRASITSLADETGVDFTFTGKDPDGFAITETVAGGNITTVKTTEYFTEISDVSTDGATTGAITVGSANEATTKTLPVDSRQQNFDLAMAVFLSDGASLTYESQHTLDNIQRVDGPFNWLTNDSFTGKIADDDGNIKFPVRAVRFVLKDFVSGSISATILQSGYRS